MARRKGDSGFGIELSPDMAIRIIQLVAAKQAEEPHRKVSKAEIVRSALHLGLRMMEEGKP